MERMWLLECAKSFSILIAKRLFSPLRVVKYNTEFNFQTGCL